jgi:hypothetical protein
VEIVYAMTSLDHRAADSRLLADWLPGHRPMRHPSWGQICSLDESTEIAVYQGRPSLVDYRTAAAAAA